MVATVMSLSSAAVTTRYFERDGYYAKADPEHRRASRWHGRGAAALGLGRNVAPSRFGAVLAGAAPRPGAVAVDGGGHVPAQGQPQPGAPPAHARRDRQHDPQAGRELGQP